MARLSEEVKLFIVQAFACFQSPKRIARAVKEKFSLDVDPRHVHRYDPEANGDVAPKWVEIHGATRESFLAGVGDIPVAHVAYRLSELNRLYEAAVSARNPVLRLQILKQAAEEVGGRYTNKQVLDLTGSIGVRQEEPVGRGDAENLLAEEGIQT